jgi:hypothetical protein
MHLIWRLHRRQSQLNRNNSSAPAQIARSPDEKNYPRDRERVEREAPKLVALRRDSTPKPKNKSIAQDTTITIGGREIEFASSRDMSSRVCGNDWELAPLSDGGGRSKDRDSAPAANRGTPAVTVAFFLTRD